MSSPTTAFSPAYRDDLPRRDSLSPTRSKSGGGGGGGPSSTAKGKKRKPRASANASASVVKSEFEDESMGMDVDVDVEDEIGELLGDDDGEPEREEEREKRIPPPGDIKCEWAECDSTFALGDDLVTHVKEDHINLCKESFICEWRTCPRLGQKQASKHSLMTHSRMHTGERPYACTAPDCNKTFTRSDALNKHMRSQHNPHAPPPIAGPSTPSTAAAPGSAPTAKASTKRTSNPASVSVSSLAAPDSDLMLDEDIAEVLPRIRRRDLLLTEGEDEKAAMAYMRSLHPREEDDQKGKKKGNSKSKASHLPPKSTKDKEKGKGNGKYEHEPFPDSAKYVDPLDSPPSSTPPSPVLESTTLDPDEPGGEIALLSRTKWQVRYVRAKARMMLVDEENRMRRKDLEDLMAEGGGGGETI